MARRLWCQPIITLSTTDEESDSDAVEPLRQHRKPLKFGKLYMANSMVLKMVTWPHELIYTAMGQPTMYEDLSVTRFVSGYLAIMEIVKRSIKHIMAKHLKKLMADDEVYGWAPVRAYYAIWLQQIENG